MSSNKRLSKIVFLIQQSASDNIYAFLIGFDTQISRARLLLTTTSKLFVPENLLQKLRAPYSLCLTHVNRQTISLQNFRHRNNRFLIKWSTRRTNYPNLFCYKTLHVSGIFSAHYQEFSTVHSTLVSFMQVYDDRFQAESGCSILTLLGSGHQKRA